jgi:radical SAM protein (TIGR01212 family)
MQHARINSLSNHLRETFGGPVRKVTFKAGLTCPNRDGTRGRGGCIFCSGVELVPAHFVPGEGTADQIRRGIAAAARGKAGSGLRFIAYLQDHTGTHCSPQFLRGLLSEAAGVENVVGLSVGTRPDCLGEPILDVLGEIALSIPLWLEIGLQTASDTTLHDINRNHTSGEFARAAAAANERGISVVAHVVLGLPGEGFDEAAATADLLAQSGVSGLKLHNLLVLRDTALAGDLESGRYIPLSRAQYSDMAVRFLERTPPDVVVHRLAAEAPGDLIAGPDWASDKHSVISAIEAELESRDTWQGRLYRRDSKSYPSKSTEVLIEEVHQA